MGALFYVYNRLVICYNNDEKVKGDVYVTKKFDDHGFNITLNFNVSYSVRNYEALQAR